MSRLVGCEERDPGSNYTISLAPDIWHSSHVFYLALFVWRSDLFVTANSILVRTIRVLLPARDRSASNIIRTFKPALWFQTLSLKLNFLIIDFFKFFERLFHCESVNHDLSLSFTSRDLVLLLLCCSGYETANHIILAKLILYLFVVPPVDATLSASSHFSSESGKNLESAEIRTRVTFCEVKHANYGIVTDHGE